MPIAVIVAVALAALPVSKAPVNRTAPPIVIDIAAITEVSPSLMTALINETDAVFRAAGVFFQWRRDGSSLATLRVFITNEAGPEHTGNATPLGWLAFTEGVPTREIHVSYGNAVQFMEDSREVVGPVRQKTVAERNALLGRALGRALAHELGHYLLATPHHSSRGLLKGARTAQEFFSLDRTPFSIAAVERRQILARLTRESDVASRN